MADDTAGGVAGRRPSRGRLILGGLLILLGVVWLLDVLGVTILWQPTLSVVLILVGLGLIVLAPRGVHGGLLTAGVALTVVLSVIALAPAPLTGGVGDSRVRPDSLAELQAGYDQAVGELTVDLRSLELPPGTTDLQAEVGMGELTVIVPEDVTVRLDASAGLGDIEALGQRRSGFGADLEQAFIGAGEAELRLRASVGLGRVEVRR